MSRWTIRTTTKVIMQNVSYRNRLRWLSLTLLAVCIYQTSAVAQVGQSGPNHMAPVEIASLSPPAPMPTSAEPLPAGGFAFVAAATPSKKPILHSFWDRENCALFAATGATATADFFVTHANLASGGRELNPTTRLFTGSTPMLASNFALQTAGVIGVSYLFHKTGHHKLERLTSILNTSASSGAVIFDLTRR